MSLFGYIISKTITGALKREQNPLFCNRARCSGARLMPNQRGTHLACKSKEPFA